MNRWFLVLCGFSASLAWAQAPATESEKILYAMGVSFSKDLLSFELSARELSWVDRGMLDAASGKDLKSTELATSAQTNQFLKRRRHKLNDLFLQTAAKAPGAKKSPSGYVVNEIQPGTGDSPGPIDAVKLKFTGSLIDGTLFESTYKRGEPALFVLDRVVPCWTQAIQQMKAGGKYKLICPSNLGYGENGFRPLIPPGSVLVFELELLEVLHRTAQPDGGSGGTETFPAPFESIPHQP